MILDTVRQEHMAILFVIDSNIKSDIRTRLLQLGPYIALLAI